MQILMYKTGRTPRVMEVDNELSCLQGLVNGNIEVIGLGEGYLLVADEEGRLKNRPVNRVIRLNGFITTIQGDFFICKAEGEDFVGLTDEEAIYAAISFIYDPTRQ